MASRHTSSVQDHRHLFPNGIQSDIGGSCDDLYRPGLTHIDRGYYGLDETLRGLGAGITRA